MDEEALEKIEARLERVSGLPWRLSEQGMHVLGHGGAMNPFLHYDNCAGNREFAVHAPEDVRRLVAEVRLLRSLASDCARWQAGEEAGRLQALRWAMRHKRPASHGGQWLWTGMESVPHSDDLPYALFALLEGGAISPAGGRRIYPSREEAMADLAQAMVRLARKGFPVEKED
jgi:hypothetical protein